MPHWSSLSCVVFAVLLLFPRAALAQGFGSFMSPGELATAHADLEGITQCTKCHEAGKGVSATRCLACHDEIASDVAAKEGFHATLGDRCERCHPDHRGRAFDMVRFDEAVFDHGLTGFPLEGAHGNAECSDCHVDTDTWRGVKTACADCHDDVHGAAASTRGLLARCDACHTSVDWDALPLLASVFDHSRPEHADYPLVGAHAEVACEACHADARFVPTPHAACTDCHADPHKGRLGAACTNCHPTPRTWHVGTFDHAKTAFPLEGQHAAVECSACHGRDQTRRVPHATCEDCHDDPHAGQFAPRVCADCHTTAVAAFALPDFDHAVTGWPLRGQHEGVACAACHGEAPAAVYADLPAEDCATCHEDPHAGKFAPSPCAVCHEESSWAVADFDHDRTDYPLQGAHQGLACEGCHASGYGEIPHGSCLDCHADEEPHQKSLSPTSCTDCHGVTTWADLAFDHAVRTLFALEPQHVAVACAGCHAEPDFKGLTGQCEGCHERPKGHYPGECASCHEGAAWLPAGFGALGHDVTGFSLHGRHTEVACEACHADGEPRGAAGTGCVDCHAGEDPHEHLLGDTCQDCHGPSTWHRVTWRHEQTGWPLRGGHRLAWCSDCHATGYAGTPRDCVRCHEAEGLAAGVAAHETPEFRECDTCHQPFTWVPTGYPHY